MHPYPPTLNIPNAQGYYYNNGEIHQHQPDNPGFPMHGGLMVSNEFYSTNTKTPEMMPNLPQEQPSPPMYYTPTNNVPFNNNNPSNCSISTPSSNSNTSSNITTATSPVSSFPSPQTRHNSLTSDTSVSSIQFPEEDKLSPLTRNTKLPKDKREKALERNRQAALRCRQRKKEWLNQLQYNVEVLTRENRMLEQQSISLREEILNLKTVLLTHRDCSVSQQPGSLDIEKVIYKPVL